MDMTLNSSLIVKQRNARAWSQQQLAQICDVSLRTIQRAENNGNASQETVKALAAAFEIKVTDLLMEETPLPAVQTKDSMVKRFALACSAIIGVMSMAGMMVANTSAGDVKISAVKKQLSSSGEGTEYWGNVLISLPAETELSVTSMQAWDVEEVTLFKGEVTLTFDGTTIHLNEASIHSQGGIAQISSTYARVVKS